MQAFSHNFASINPSPSELSSQTRSYQPYSTNLLLPHVQFPCRLLSCISHEARLIPILSTPRIHNSHPNPICQHAKSQPQPYPQGETVWRCHPAKSMPVEPQILIQTLAIDRLRKLTPTFLLRGGAKRTLSVRISISGCNNHDVSFLRDNWRGRFCMTRCGFRRLGVVLS
jgi:hypothetical protein